MPITDQNKLAQADLLRVRTLFASPERITESDFLRREISQRMAERLDLLKFVPECVLDAGCGTGRDLCMLQERYPQSLVIGLDASPQLLAQIPSQKKSRLRRMADRFFSTGLMKQSLLCGDFASMPFTVQSLDMLWSNLALHWHAHPETVFAEWRRVLRVDGLLMFSCLGPDTFKELRQAFSTVDSYPHALDFVDMHDLGDMLHTSGFATPVVDMEMMTLTYETPEKLLQDARAFGGNPLPNRRRGLFGRQAWTQVLRELESLRQRDGRIPLTLEVIYGHAFRPAQSQANTGEKIVNFVPRK